MLFHVREVVRKTTRGCGCCVTNVGTILWMHHMGWVSNWLSIKSEYDIRSFYRRDPRNNLDTCVDNTNIFSLFAFLISGRLRSQDINLTLKDRHCLRRRPLKPSESDEQPNSTYPGRTREESIWSLSESVSWTVRKSMGKSYWLELHKNDMCCFE